MLLASLARRCINRALYPLNLRLETLTADLREDKRLGVLESLGHFQHPVFPVPESFNSDNYLSVLAAVTGYRTRFDDFHDALQNEVGYTFDNDYFTSPDAEVLYTLVRETMPSTIVEVGCGNTTKIIRQAILDGKLTSQLISIDPQPRTEIKAFTSQLYLESVERLECLELYRSLKEGDILFIDSSHEIRIGND